MQIFRRWHRAILLWLVRYFRTQEVLKVFAVAHANELKQLELTYWPLVRRAQGQELQQVRQQLSVDVSAMEYKQLQERAAIRAGQLEIVDRKSWAFPFLPSTVQRLALPIMKATPYNLRRMARTPVPRRAINLIKGALISQPWGVEPLPDVEGKDEDEQQERCNIARKIFAHPNGQDSFQTFIEMGTEDMCIFGAMPIELRVTPDPERPIKMWAVNVESIRIFASWTEATPDMPHYAQMTGLKGERGAVLFYDDELMYVKDNPATDNPFGLGRMEVAFRSISDFLGIQEMSGRAGVDQTHKTWLWWEQPQSESGYQIVRRHIQNELEGQAKVSLIGGMKKPDVIEIQPVVEADLLLGWQEMLIRMIANSFDMSAMALGIEHDVNRATGEVLDDRDFRSAIVPMAKRIQEAFTRKILHEKLGWYDLQFRFLNLEDPDIQTKMDLLARMYSVNAATPNQILVRMGWEKSKSPFADLSQFEAMLLNTETAFRLQQRQAASAQAPPMPAPGMPALPGGGTGDGAPMPPGVSVGKGQIKAPPKITTPKFPIAGTAFTASQLAAMEVAELIGVLDDGGLSPTKTLGEMKSQDPTILEEMSDALKDFFEKAVEVEKKAKKTRPRAVMTKWLQQQKKLYLDQQKRKDDMSSYLQERSKVLRKDMREPSGRH